MPKVAMISAGVHRYNGVWLKAGDPFDVDNETDASDLETIRYAKRAPVPVAPAAAPEPAKDMTYDTRALSSELPQRGQRGQKHNYRRKQA